MKLPVHFLQYYGYVAATVGWLLLSAPFHSPTRSMMRRMATVAGWGGLKTKLPQVHLNELVSAEAAVRIDNSVDHESNISFYELFVLSQLVADRRPRRVFEFGTFNGRTTLHLAMNTPPDTRLLTIDLPEHESPFEDHSIVGSCFRGTPYAERITQLYENTRRWDLSAYRDQMNFIFIDASHEYEDVCGDTDLAMQLACPQDCTIVWHDYSQWQGVQQAVDERFVAGGQYTGLRHIRGTSMAVLELGRRTMADERARLRREASPVASAAPSPTPSPSGRGPG